MATRVGPGRTYRRSLGTRLLSLVCAPVFTGGAISFAATTGPTAGFYLLVCAAGLSLVNLVTAWADRFTLDEEGIEYRNALLLPLGLGRRRVAWEDVVRVREHRRPGTGVKDDRPSALFLTVRSGRRMVLDSLEGYDEVVRTVRHHCVTSDDYRAARDGA